MSDVFTERAEYLSDRLTVPISQPRIKVEFRTASATNLPFQDGLFGAALTSPPYATRIDYVRGTLPELAVFGAEDKFVADLRLETTGSPVVDHIETNRHYGLHSMYGMKVLTKIEEHSSKGSRAYYKPWMRAYLTKLQTGLFETDRTVDNDGVICIVVQDSYYKEFRVDIQRIVTEMMESRGRVLKDRKDFPARILRSRMNPRAKRHSGSRRNTESLLVFE